MHAYDTVLGVLEAAIYVWGPAWGEVRAHTRRFQDDLGYRECGMGSEANWRRRSTQDYMLVKWGREDLPECQGSMQDPGLGPG